MNYLTNYYKNRAEQLQERVKVLEAKILSLQEIAEVPDDQKPDLLKSASMAEFGGFDKASFQDVLDKPEVGFFFPEEPKTQKPKDSDDTLLNLGGDLMHLVSALSNPHHPIHKFPQVKESTIGFLKTLGVPDHMLKFADHDKE